MLEKFMVDILEIFQKDFVRAEFLGNEIYLNLLEFAYLRCKTDGQQILRISRVPSFARVPYQKEPSG